VVSKWASVVQQSIVSPGLGIVPLVLPGEVRPHLMPRSSPIWPKPIPSPNTRRGLTHGVADANGTAAILTTLRPFAVRSSCLSQSQNARHSALGRRGQCTSDTVQRDLQGYLVENAMPHRLRTPYCRFQGHATLAASSGRGLGRDMVTFVIASSL
jgi:hypothetical protein